MGCCCEGHKKELNISILSESSISAKFHYNNDKFFYGYPRYYELKEQLHNIICQQKKNWIIYQEQLQRNQTIIINYVTILQGLLDNLKGFIKHETDIFQLAETSNISLPPEFNIDLIHSLRLEAQTIEMNLLNEFKGDKFNLMDSHISISIAINYKGSEVEYKAQYVPLTRKNVTLNSLHIYKLDTQPDWEKLNQTGQIVYSEDILKDAQFSLQVLQQNMSGMIRKIGKPVTFNLRDFSDQQISEKRVKIVQLEGSETICVILMRFQLLYNIGSFCTWWKNELSERKTQIEKILKKIENLKLQAFSVIGNDVPDVKVIEVNSNKSISYDISNEQSKSFSYRDSQNNFENNRRVDSLLSYDHSFLRNDSKVSIYELPFKIK